tara:strand:+ start:210 stop:428 length:219 start_codon:yes stop_codon:yes gene_type:complete
MDMFASYGIQRNAPKNRTRLPYIGNIGVIPDGTGVIPQDPVSPAKKSFKWKPVKISENKNIESQSGVSSESL